MENLKFINWEKVEKKKKKSSNKLKTIFDRLIDQKSKTMSA